MVHWIKGKVSCLSKNSRLIAAPHAGSQGVEGAVQMEPQNLHPEDKLLFLLALQSAT